MEQTYQITFTLNGIEAKKYIQADNILDAIFKFSLDYPLYKIEGIKKVNPENDD